MMKVLTQQEILAYKNQDVIYRFVKIYGVSETEANQLFEDLKRWLWMASQVRASGIDKPLVIDTALVIIDEMWHNFMLFTKDYFEFCDHFFGTYMHHSPNTQGSIDKEMKKMEGLSLQDRKKMLMDRKRWQYEFVYDHLGEDTFVRWYKTYPKQYTVENLAEMALATERNRSSQKQLELKNHKAAMLGAA